MILHLEAHIYKQILLRVSFAWIEKWGHFISLRGLFLGMEFRCTVKDSSENGTKPDYIELIQLLKGDVILRKKCIIHG